MKGKISKKLNSKEWKLMHSGYFSDLYLSKKINQIKKIYRRREDVLESPKSKIEDVFFQELDGTLWLSKVTNPMVVTPNITEIDRSNLSFQQQFFKITPFYQYIKKHEYQDAVAHLEKVFYAFGNYLAQLHETPTNSGKIRCHGDLKHKNLGFVKEKLFIYDPTFVERWIYAKPEREIAKFLLNFFPYNPLLNNSIRKHRILYIKRFLSGYRNKSGAKISGDVLRDEMIDVLQKANNKLMSTKFLCRIKYFFMRVLCYFLIKNIRSIQL